MNGHDPRLRPDLGEAAKAAGADVVEIPRKEAWGLLQAWREIYCAPFRGATGKWVGGRAWHTFSGGYFPSVRRQRALDEYLAQNAADLLVLPEDDRYAAVRCTGSVPINFSALSLDVYVAPSSFAWTMVFTHEYPEYGPYFAHARWRDGIGSAAK